MRKWTFTARQSPILDFSKAVDLSAEFPSGAFLRLPIDWSAVPADQQPKHEVATGNVSINMVIGRTAVGAGSSVSAADADQQLYVEDKGILPDNGQELPHSMALHDNTASSSADSNRISSVSGARTMEALGTIAAAVDAICTIHGAAPSNSGASARSDECKSQSPMVPRYQGSWPAASEAVASEPPGLMAMRRVEVVQTREHALLEQLQHALAEAERTRGELEEARKALENVNEVGTAKEVAACGTAAVLELEMALVAESARVLELTQRSEQAEASHRAELQQLRLQLETACERLQLADTEHKDLHAAHVATQEELKQLSVQLAAARSELDTLNQERDHLQSDHARLTEEAQKEIATMAEEASSLYKCTVGMQANQQQLQADLWAAENEARVAKERLADVQASVEILEAKQEDLRKDLVVARNIAEDATSRLQVVESEKTSVVKRARQLRQEEQVRRNNLAKNLATVQAILREREAQLQAAEEELLAAKEKLQAEAVSQSRALAEAQARGAEAEARAEATVAVCAAKVKVERSKAAHLQAEMQVARRRLLELRKLAWLCLILATSFVAAAIFSWIVHESAGSCQVMHLAAKV
ncbi:hypothetical protein VOLCADRAFT_94534 [Volvox carteri f. nagariensis]|uniref:Uncharacterized protein n=1 Tax=Volvox carteri f. nagariensis TaxID=3068 RepID=D8U517_VOLCA|nr:uncharacterized protein VOLCADRAFT_94534 [Volvox carteri f. nagariensis]EFJ45069.1 hypothetical protein VOLCADRAFT_94534 [Volvox carteri f. nagariensis]|eukprot:XP_002953745.1 hypothetical protein VOLCADRAFT_94534 [Volvox carteri f. nagariensis]